MDARDDNQSMETTTKGQTMDSDKQPTAAAIRATCERDDWTTGRDDGLTDAERAILDSAADADFTDVDDGAREAFRALQAKRDKVCARCGRDIPTLFSPCPACGDDDDDDSDPDADDYLTEAKCEDEAEWRAAYDEHWPNDDGRA